MRSTPWKEKISCAFLVHSVRPLNSSKNQMNTHFTTNRYHRTLPVNPCVISTQKVRQLPFITKTNAKRCHFARHCQNNSKSGGFLNKNDIFQTKSISAPLTYLFLINPPSNPKNSSPKIKNRSKRRSASQKETSVTRAQTIPSVSIKNFDS